MHQYNSEQRRLPLYFRHSVKCILTGLWCLFCLAVNSQSIPDPDNYEFSVIAKVDERIELFAIIARLAEFEEYSSTPLIGYASNIDDYFREFKEHDLITYLKFLREEYSLGYDAVMTMAVHLSSPPELAPRVELTKEILDDRWGEVSRINDFLILLQRFYEDSQFSSFFDSQADLYQVAEDRFQDLINEIDFGWYSRFYRELPDGTFNLYIRLHSKGSYGPYVDLPNGKRDVYAILSTTKSDAEGLPIYDRVRLGTIIHEFNHSFINHLFWPIATEFESSASTIFTHIGERLRKVGYGNWESVVLESLANAAEVVYLREQEIDSDLAKENLVIDRNRGFIWIDELVNILGAYQGNVKMHPNFSAFFPFFIGYFNDLSARFTEEIDYFELMTAKVVDVLPLGLLSEIVDSEINQISIVFSQALDDKYDIRLDQISARGIDHPIISVEGLNANGTILILNVKLESDKYYEFPITILDLETRNGYPVEDYVIKFEVGSD